MGKVVLYHCGLYHYGKKGMHWGERNDEKPIGYIDPKIYDRNEANAKVLRRRRAALRGAATVVGATGAYFMGRYGAKALYDRKPHAGRAISKQQVGRDWLKAGAGAAAVGVSLAMMYKSNRLKPIRSYRNSDGTLTESGRRYVKSYDTYTQKQKKMINEADHLVQNNRKLHIDYGGTATNIRDYDAFDQKLKAYNIKNTSAYSASKNDAAIYAKKHYASILEGREIAREQEG